MRPQLCVMLATLFVDLPSVFSQISGPGKEDETQSNMSEANGTTTISPGTSPVTTRRPMPTKFTNTSPCSINEIYSPAYCTCDCDNTHTHTESGGDDDDDYDWLWWKEIDVNDSKLCVPHCAVSLSCEYPPSCRDQMRAIDERRSIQSENSVKSNALRKRQT